MCWYVKGRGNKLWFSIADGGMRQAARIERSQLVTEIRGESRARGNLVQAEFGWRRCLHNTYLIEIIVDWNVTTCSLTDGTKIVSLNHKTLFIVTSISNSHLIYLFSGIMEPMVLSPTKQKPGAVLRSERESTGREVFTGCWLKFYLNCLKENT